MIPYGRHSIDQDDINSVVNVLKSNWLTGGSVVEEFEQKLCNLVNAQYVVSCSNGTTALHLALCALNIKPDDIIFVPAITFLASANAGRYLGAHIIFVDVDPDTGLMTAETLEESIQKNKNKPLKAVINVHLTGQCENLEKIYQVAKKYNLLIIEDAAHALGTIYLDSNIQKYPIGSNQFSDLTTFSFHPVKTIATGEGGAVATNDPQIAKKMCSLRSHGMIRESREWLYQEQGFCDVGLNPWYYEMDELGFNYRISDINCALGLSQLNKLPFFKKQRAELVSRYDEAFKEISFITPIKKRAHSDTAWHLYVILIDFIKIGKSRAEVMNHLKEKNIGTQVHYIPLYLQPYYKKLYGDIKLKGAEEYYSKCLSLPLYIGLDQSDQDRIIEGILNLLKVL